MIIYIKKEIINMTTKKNSILFVGVLSAYLFFTNYNATDYNDLQLPSTDFMEGEKELPYHMNLEDYSVPTIENTLSEYTNQEILDALNNKIYKDENLRKIVDSTPREILEETITID